VSESRGGSLHAIIFLGLMAAGTMVVLMMFSLENLEKSAAGTRAKLAAAVKDEYKAVSATAEWAGQGESMSLRVSYVTDAALPVDGQRDQMRDCAQFVYAESLKYEDRELYRIRRVDVTRVQVRGSGCFQDRFEAHYGLDLPTRPPPAKKAAGPRDPQ
jgi:hypothetical protein